MRGVIIAGTHSGCGKTTITLGVLAALRKKHYKVQSFKAGPDFIDTGLHKLITGRASINLDLWMCGRDYVIECFYKYSANVDIVVVEGVMGMYDGNLSTADLAATIGLPVILIVDAYGMAESGGAIVKGFCENSKFKIQNSELIAGVIFNRVASDRHYNRLKDSVKDVPVLGYLPRNLEFKIPHRHLGLVVAEENPIDSGTIAKLAETVLEHVDIDVIVQKCKSVEVQKNNKTLVNSINITSRLPSFRNSTLKIAVAHDKAFCFYYEDNLDLLKKEGVEIVTFSPLSDSKIPAGVSALYLGGGYPELYAQQLSSNKSMLKSIINCVNNEMSVYAECGGFMYLTEGMYDFDNAFYPMVGAFPIKTKMTKGRAKLGYREAVLNHDCIFGEKGTIVRGHEFHYSEIKVQKSEVRSQKSEKQKETDNLHLNPQTLEPLNPYLIYTVKDGDGNYLYDEGYRVKNTLGSYIHIHFGSNKSIAKNFIKFISPIRKEFRTG